MLAIAATFLMAWTAMLVWPGVEASAALRDWLVVRPAARLAAIRRGDVAVAVVILAGVTVMTLCADDSAVRLLLYAVPDDPGVKKVEISSIFTEPRYVRA